MSTLYEIVILANGDFALQRADEQDEPLIRIRFSDEARHILQSADLDVARAMIDAGIDMVAQLGDDEDVDDESEHPRVLH